MKRKPPVIHDEDEMQNTEPHQSEKSIPKTKRKPLLQNT